jgi:ABC-type uncharacterized transport system permease subunit
VLYRTPVGLAVRMVGENPQAAEGQGVSVVGVRTGAIVLGSAFMGVAGSFLTLSAFNAFFFNMVNGRGWICVALVAVPLVAYMLYRTPVGLAVRMVGENPQAAEGQGVSVVGVRTGAIVLGSAFMGVAGSFLTLSAFNAFFFNMVNGRGWICVALVVFASWRPGKALLGALLFAFFDALQLRLQQSGAAVLPYQMYLMLPYVLSILALVLVARRASYPQALMKPYRKGER